jgi:hypothetical protein
LDPLPVVVPGPGPVPPILMLGLAMVTAKSLAMRRICFAMVPLLLPWAIGSFL